ncbi:MAG: hypothetical protein EAZ53_08240 [Bacteroidetes bacterium]|nr:MAG: hypothetical protein EAZ53_08240 [Bacteroidota bacterium]
MARIAGISTQTNAKGIVTKITVDLKKHPKVKEALIEIGYLTKTQQQIEDEEFEKDWNNPTNLTVEQARQLSLEHINSLKWDK